MIMKKCSMFVGGR